MSETKVNTNLAAEFLVLSNLYRIGANAYLTLGNKKSVDIVVDNKGRVLTIDVKGLRSNTSFPIDNHTLYNKNHFLIFVAFNNKIDQTAFSPEVYIVPSIELNKKHKVLDGLSIVYQNESETRKVISLSRLRKLSTKYKDRWDYFI